MPPPLPPPSAGEGGPRSGSGEGCDGAGGGGGRHVCAASSGRRVPLIRPALRATLSRKRESDRIGAPCRRADAEIEPGRNRLSVRRGSPLPFGRGTRVRVENYQDGTEPEPLRRRDLSGSFSPLTPTLSRTGEGPAPDLDTGEPLTVRSLPPSAGEGGPCVSGGRERGATVQSEAVAVTSAQPHPDAGFPSPDPLRGPPSPAEGGGRARRQGEKTFLMTKSLTGENKTRTPQPRAVPRRDGSCNPPRRAQGARAA